MMFQIINIFLLNVFLLHIFILKHLSIHCDTNVIDDTKNAIYGNLVALHLV